MAKFFREKLNRILALYQLDKKSMPFVAGLVTHTPENISPNIEGGQLRQMIPFGNVHLVKGEASSLKEALESKNFEVQRGDWGFGAPRSSAIPEQEIRRIAAYIQVDENNKVLDFQPQPGVILLDMNCPTYNFNEDYDWLELGTTCGQDVEGVHEPLLDFLINLSSELKNR